MKNILLNIAFSTIFNAVAIAQTNYCKDISKSVNEFKETTTFVSPQLKNVILYKYFIKGQKSSTIVVSTLSYTLDYDLRGVYIKLDDGSILKNETFKSIVRYDGNNKYEYYSQIDLSESELQRLSEHKIIAYGIGEMIINLKNKDGLRYQGYAKCLASINTP